MLSLATQHTMCLRIRWKVGNRVSEHSVLSAYPALCGIQREADFFLISFCLKTVQFYTHVQIYICG